MVDTRGLACPIPVVMVQKAVKEKPDTLQVLADAEVAVENITRFARSHGYQISVAEEGMDYRLTLTK